MSDTGRRVIARAIARSGLHYKRSALWSGLVALALCPLVLVVDEIPQKGVVLILAMVLAVTTYLSVRRSQRHFDLDSSPVLLAIARDPTKLAKVSSARPKPTGPWLVTVEDDAAHRLTLRLPPEASEEELSALLTAFAELAPDAVVARGALDASSDRAD